MHSGPECPGDDMEAGTSLTMISAEPEVLPVA
jgi:hypothetical protein